MRALVTGANGFLGKNLQVHLRENDIEVSAFTREISQDQLPECLLGVDFIFHLAGVNRSSDVSEFVIGNNGLTQLLCNAVRASGRKIPVLYTSSIQADLDSPYGSSKQAAEELLIALENETGSPVYIYRLPNIFGKWSRPNYNSVVATFCHNIANDLPIQIDNPTTNIPLIYVDDVVADFMRLYLHRPAGLHRPQIDKLYNITVKDLAEKICAFKESKETFLPGGVGSGLTRALYSTYLSFLKPEQFSYSVKAHADQRGRFVEILKTKDSGQFSFFTAYPGITRGGHYHHSKNEKFMVVQGKAKFCFRHIVTDETYELFADSESPQIVQTVPGWAHEITNVGDNEMIVMLWANEIFDIGNPDTVAFKV